jgi:RNA polymerase sigma-70 factor (ECF subfamily)
MSSQSDEADLLSRALTLDPLALGEIHDRYYQDVYRYAYLRTDDPHLSDDIASETFLRLLKALHGGQPPHTTLRGWLFGVAAHLVVDHFNSRKTLPLFEYFSDGHSMQTEVEEHIRNEDVKSAMGKLTAEQQEILVLRFSSGLSVQEAANLMNRSVTAVKALQFRAVDALRRLLVEVENE